MELTIASVQFQPQFKNLDANFEYIKEVTTNADANVIVFPELSSSGYFFTDKRDLKKCAWTSDSDEIQELQEMAEEQEKIIVFGFPEKDEKNIYNSAAILLPDRDQSSIYRKTHLFYKERFVFQEGNTGFFVINYDEWDLNLGTMICYDWRFPEAARTLALKGADLIVCPANLVTGVWDNVMSARALENKVYLLVSNRVGDEYNDNESLTFNGMSAIYSFDGKKLVQAGEENEIIITSAIDPSLTRDKSFNAFNDIFEDRRSDLYEG